VGKMKNIFELVTIMASVITLAMLTIFLLDAMNDCIRLGVPCI